MATKVAEGYVELKVIQNGLVAGMQQAKAAVVGGVASIGTAASGIGLAALGAFAAASAMLKSFVDKAIDGEDASTRLEATVRATGNAAGFTADQLENMIKEMNKTAAVSNNAMRQAASLLLTFRSVKGDNFKDALRACQDLAAVGFGTLEGNAVQLGKALEDPITGLGALRRAGVSFSAEERNQIEDLVKHNRLREAQTLILASVKKQVGGVAEAMSKTTSGQLFIATRMLGDAKKAIGQELLPSVRATIPWMRALADVIQKNADIFRGVGRGIGGFVSMMLAGPVAILKAWGSLSPEFKDFIGSLMSLVSMIGLVNITLSVLGKVASYVAPYLRFVTAPVRAGLAVYDGIAGSINRMTMSLTGFGNPARAMMGLIQGPLKAAFYGLAGMMGGVMWAVTKMGVAFDMARGKLAISMLMPLVRFLGSMTAGIYGVARAIVGSLFSAVNGIMPAISNLVRGVSNNVWNMGAAGVRFFGKAITETKTAVVAISQALWKMTTTIAGIAWAPLVAGFTRIKAAAGGGWLSSFGSLFKSGASWIMSWINPLALLTGGIRIFSAALMATGIGALVAFGAAFMSALHTEEFKAEIDSAKTSLLSSLSEIGSAFMNALGFDTSALTFWTDLKRIAVDALVWVAKWVEENKAKIAEWAAIIADVLSAAWRHSVAAVTFLWDVVKSIFDGIASLVSSVTGGATVSFSDFIMYSLYLFTRMGDSWSYMWNLMKETAGVAFDWFANGIKTIYAGLVGAVEAVKDVLSALFNNLMATIDRVKGYVTSFFSALASALAAAVKLENPLAAFREAWDKGMDDMQRDARRFQGIGQSAAEGFNRGYNSVMHDHNPESDFTRRAREERQRLGQDIAQGYSTWRNRMQNPGGGGGQRAIPAPERIPNGEDAPGSNTNPIKYELKTTAVTDMWKKMQESVTGKLEKIGERNLTVTTGVRENTSEAVTVLRSINNRVGPPAAA